MIRTVLFYYRIVDFASMEFRESVYVGIVFNGDAQLSIKETA